MEKDLNVGLEIIKLLEENIGRKLLDIDLSWFFLYLIWKAKPTTGNINKQNYIKLNLCTVEKTINNKQQKKELYLWTGFSSGLKIRKHLKNTKEKLTVYNIICIPSLNGFIPLFIYPVLIWSKGRHSWLLKKSETVITQSGFQHTHFP